MGCLKDKKTPKPKPGWFACKDCKAAAKTKKNICNPKRIKK